MREGPATGSVRRGWGGPLGTLLLLGACAWPTGCGRTAAAPESAADEPGGAADAETPADAGNAANEASPEPPVADVLVETEPAEASWHAPVAERAPATEAAQTILDTLAAVEEKLIETRYQYNTVVRERSGKYFWDCSGMAAWVLEQAAPRARAVLSDDHPLAREFYDTIAESPTDDPHHGWLRVADPEQIGPGDLFAWRKPDFWAERPNTGHVGFVVGTPQPHPVYADVWVMRIADATRMLHEADSRPVGGEGGYGTGTMAFLFDGTGTPIAYGWYGAAQPPDTFVPTTIAFGRVSR
jgi:hypothetical protein